MRVFDVHRWDNYGNIDFYPKLITSNQTNNCFLEDLYHLLICDRSSEDETRPPLADHNTVLAELITLPIAWMDYSQLWEAFSEILEDSGRCQVVVHVINRMKIGDPSSFNRWIEDTEFFSIMIMKNIKNSVSMGGLKPILLNCGDCSSSSSISSDEIALKALLLLLEIRKENLLNMDIWSQLKEILSTIENSRFISEVLQLLIDLTKTPKMSYRQFYKLEFHRVLLAILEDFKQDSVMVDKVMEVMSLFFASKNAIIKLNDLEAMNVVFEVVLTHYKSGELPVIETFLGLLVKEDTSEVVDSSILTALSILLNYYSMKPHEDYSSQGISFYYDFLFEYTKNKNVNSGFYLQGENQMITALVNNLSVKDRCKATCFLLTHMVKKTPGIDQHLLDQGIIATLVDLLTVKFSRFPEGVDAILNFILACPFFMDEFCTALDTKITGLLAFFYNLSDILADLLTLLMKFNSCQLKKLRDDQMFTVVFYDVLLKNFKISNGSEIPLGLQILAKIITPEYLQANKFYGEVLLTVFTNFQKYKSETLKAIFLASVKDVVNNQIIQENVEKLVGIGCTAKVLVSMKLERENLALIKPHLPLTLMKEMGACATDLRALSCTIDELFTIGYSSLELTKANFSATEMFSVGFSLSDLHKVKFPLKNLQNCSNLEDLRATGYELKDFKDAEFPIIKLKQLYSLSDFKAADYDYEELSLSGFSPGELEAADLRKSYYYYDWSSQ
jgi:hypothetical protein